MEGLTTVIRNNVEAAMAHVSVSITPVLYYRVRGNLTQMSLREASLQADILTRKHYYYYYYYYYSLAQLHNILF